MPLKSADSWEFCETNDVVLQTVDTTTRASMLAVSHERSRTRRYKVQGDRCCLAQVFGGDPFAAETMPGGGQNQAAKLSYWFPAMLRVGFRFLVVYKSDTGPTMNAFHGVCRPG